MPNLIRQLRVARNWSQSTLAEKMGVNQKRVSDLERGIYPEPAETEKIVKIFELDSLNNGTETHTS